jgi:hypothetical protein
MSANSPDNKLKSQYRAQVTADLESNAKEQERITAEVSSLTVQLAALKQDHALLTSMQQALAAAGKQAGSSAIEAGSRTPHSRSVPRARSAKKSGRTPAVVKTPKKAAVTGPVRASRNGAPTLRDLVSDQLAQQKEPRSAAEVTSALSRTYPQRKLGATVVRNTLEALVAKGQALRSKQQNSVFYSAIGATGPTASDNSPDHTPATV